MSDNIDRLLHVDATTLKSRLRCINPENVPATIAIFTATLD